MSQSNRVALGARLRLHYLLVHGHYGVRVVPPALHERVVHPHHRDVTLVTDI